MVADGEPQLPTTKHPTKPENHKKPFPPTHHQKIYFRANKRRTWRADDTTVSAPSRRVNLDGSNHRRLGRKEPSSGTVPRWNRQTESGSRLGNEEEEQPVRWPFKNS
jgi:hypothetical protein